MEKSGETMTMMLDSVEMNSIVSRFPDICQLLECQVGDDDSRLVHLRQTPRIIHDHRNWCCAAVLW